MPPKRKVKISQAASSLPAKTTARNKVSEAAKPGQVRRHSLAASSGRTSRLLPSVPFQMTTRRGAKTASAASSATSGSRRSSLNDIAQYNDAQSEIEDERPAKRSRTSTDSGSPQRSNASCDNKKPMNGTQTPELQKPASGATLTPKTAGKRRRASDESTQSSKTLSTRPNGVLTRTQSDVSEQQHRPKRRKTKEAPADSQDQPPELTDASTAPNSPEPMPDVDNHSLQNVLPTNGDAPAKAGRRLPGRRRQPHSDVNIEVDLRRQLNLKMSYRSLAKVQKNLLEELSNRTIGNLKNDAEFHEKCPENKPTMAALDRYKDSRVDQLHAARTYRLEQLDRVRTAEKHIQEEQYINRFRELQDDFLLQCYFRMKQIEREMKGDAEAGTDDEDNVLPPTYTDEPHHDVDDRLGSKFASRSRAYIEADRELENDSKRKLFDLARAAFVEKDEDADDSIDDVAGGFARFSGPPRDDAIAHYNLGCIVDAAVEVERTPEPEPEPEPEPLRKEVVTNDQALHLMVLADLSAQQPRRAPGTEQLPQESQQQQQQQTWPSTPTHASDRTREFSPVNLPDDNPMDAQTYPSRTSPEDVSQPTAQSAQQTPYVLSNGIDAVREPEPAIMQPARLSTHRIMDILNNDQDVPDYRSREPPSLVQEPSTPSRHSRHGSGGVPRQDNPFSQHNTPSHHMQQQETVGARPDSEMRPEPANSHAQEPPPVDQALMDALGGRPSEPPPSPPPSQPWSRPSIAPPLRQDSEDALRRKDPLMKIRELLDRKARELGREPAVRWSSSRAPSIYNAQTTHEQQDIAGYDPQRPSAGLFHSASTSSSAYPTSRRESQDHSVSHWEHDRRMSGLQAAHQPTQSPYQSNPPQPNHDNNRGAPTPPNHQSPYAQPPSSGSLPPKPPGPPPMNFRFAHYDPAPPRPAYPPPQSPTYPPSSHSHMGPPPSQYPPTYPSPYQGGYIPPPGSFQAPPPPPQSLSTIAPYPPLKIHQYGGQPILPANMAPPPPGPGMSFINQPLHQAAYSPHPPPPQPQQQAQPPASMYEPAREKPQKDRPPEPQPRPRRQYRSYHAPGTQFRTYKGPREGRSSGGN